MMRKLFLNKKTKQKQTNKTKTKKVQNNLKILFTSLLEDI